MTLAPDTVVPLRVIKGMQWVAELKRGERGVHATIGNVLIIMAHDPELHGLVAFDQLSHGTSVTRAPPIAYPGEERMPGPYPRPVTDTDATLIQSYIQRVYDIRISPQVAEQGIEAVRHKHAFHPIRDWLRGLEWDGVERIDTWLMTAFGCPDTPYHRAVGRKFLVASVRRMMHPGVKFDSMLILQGAQRIGKSGSLRALFGAPHFTDECPDLKNRDSAINLLGIWCVEIGELASMMSATDDVMKLFLSRQVDRYREMHGKRMVDRPRQAVITGTTNNDEIFKDTTGNTRFWPVMCVKAEPEWIAEMRDQLWAEAVVAEADNETLWLDVDDVRAEATAIQAERLPDDLWAGQVRNYVLHGSYGQGALAHVTIEAILTHAICIPVGYHERKHGTRIAAILRSIGWERWSRREGGGPPVKCWRPTPAP